MEFGKHIGKGLWAFADKALPAIYGLAFIFLVVRVLPEKEYGAFVIIQTIFTVITTMATALAFQPLLKFAAETDDNGPFIVAGLSLAGAFFAVCAGILLTCRFFLAPLFDPSGQSNIPSLLNYLPLLFLTTIYRSFSLSLLQVKYQMQKIFWIDVMYFVGTPVLILIAGRYNHFSTAADLIAITIVAQACSTILALFFTRKAMSVPIRIEREAFVKIINFGKYSFGSTSLYTVLTQMDVFFVSTYGGILGVATYNAAKIFTRIFDMLGQVLMMFLIPFSSKNYAEKSFNKLKITAEKSICFSSLLFVPVFCVLFFFPEQLLHILYHGKYDHGAGILRTFSVLALIMPWNGLATSYITGFGKVKISFVMSILYFAFAFPLYWLFTSTLGATGTSLGYVMSFGLITLILVKYVQRIVSFDIRDVIMRTGDVWRFMRRKLGGEVE